MRARGSGPLFLTELVVMLLVFSLCAGVLLELFAAARETTRETQQLGSAVLWADSAASVYKAAQGDAARAAARLSDAAVCGEDGFTLGLDAAWSPVEQGEVYVLRLREDAGGAARVSVCGPEGELFAVNVRGK